MIDLYDQLPAVYRTRDAEHGQALQALLDIVSEQADAIREDIGRLWDDFFVETCADWVLPYIGDLVGSSPLHDVADTGAGAGAGLRRRADVAKTIHYRRRKGTLPMLEQLAQDVTRWGVRAVAFFELVQWSQQLEHVRGVPARQPRLGALDTRYVRPATVDLRDLDVLQRLDGPFDDLAHTAAVRTGGWHHPRRIGFFVWRLRAYRTVDPVSARPALGGPGFHLAPLGHPAPLFNQPRPGGERNDERGVAAPLRPLAIAQRPADWYDPVLRPEDPASQPAAVADLVLRVQRNDGGNWLPVAAADLVLMDLSAWAEPPDQKMGLDVRLGRVRWRDAQPSAVRSEFSYAFSTDLGGGPYDRRRPLSEAGDEDRADTVRDPGALDRRLRVPSTATPTLAAAVAAAAAGERVVIELTGDATYTETATLALAAAEVVIQAENGRRPLLFGDLTVTGGGADARLALDGLTIAGSLTVNAVLRDLDLRHVTLVPGCEPDDDGEPLAPDRASLALGPDGHVDEVTLTSSITGPIRLAADGRLVAADSILQSPGAGGPARSSPAAMSGNLAPFPALTSTAPALRVAIGDHGPFVVTLAGRPATLSEARDLLEPALRAASDAAEFAQARVYVAGNVLIVIPGAPGEVSFERAGSDLTAAELRLTDAAATVLIGRALPATVALTAAAPKVTAIVPGAAPASVAIAAGAPTRAEIRDSLNAATAGVRFVLHEDRLAAVTPGRPGPVFSATEADPPTEADLTTVRELGLHSTRPVLAGSDDGELPGPPATLQRCTVLGEVRVRELELVSESILAAPAYAVRRQAGCVRLSSVAPGSRVPRRFRCQPDLALAAAAPELAPAVEARLAPHFTSTRYGDPGFAQLSPMCARELREGAEDGAELGAFKRLQQPQREANLTRRLEEYMPVGLDPVLIYMT
jgi:hypothetical protein